MPAERDRSQKVGFVYSNIYELYKQSQVLAKAEKEALKKGGALKSNSRVLRLDDLGNIKVTKFEPKELQKDQPVAIAEVLRQNSALGVNAKIVLHHPDAGTEKKDEAAFQELKSNIERLQDMHSKLRFMLKELEDLVGKKK